MPKKPSHFMRYLREVISHGIGLWMGAGVTIGVWFVDYLVGHGFLGGGDWWIHPTPMFYVVSVAAGLAVAQFMTWLKSQAVNDNLAETINRLQEEQKRQPQVMILSGSEANQVTGLSGGTAGRVVRLVSENLVTDASQTDASSDLASLLFRSGNGAYITPGGKVSGLSGLTAGTVYFLDVDGLLTERAPAPTKTVAVVYIGKALSATSLLFTPGPPIKGS